MGLSLAKSDNLTLKFFEEDKEIKVSAKDAAIKKLEGVVDFTDGKNSDILDLASKGILKKAFDSKNNDKKGKEKINQGKFILKNYSRHARLSFKDVDLKGAFMNSFANCIFEGKCDLTKISEDRVKFVNCTFTEECLIPLNRINLENFSNCKFTAKFIDKLGGEKEDFIKRLKIKKLGEDLYETPTTLPKESVKPILAFKLVEDIELAK